MSAIVFGTMRMAEEKGDVSYWSGLLREIYYAGVNTLHSSTEYDSFPLLQAVLQNVSRADPAVRFKHLVKLAEPHFTDAGYVSSRLFNKVEEYREKLNVNKLDAIQWMWRSNLPDEQRIQEFKMIHHELKSDFDALKKKVS
jgi:hypothetical protein